MATKRMQHHLTLIEDPLELFNSIQPGSQTCVTCRFQQRLRRGRKHDA